MDLFESLGQLLKEYQSTLHDATIELRNARNREKLLHEEMDSKKLLSNEEAVAYLKRKQQTLRYYH